MKKSFHSNKGVALVTVVIIMLIMSILGTAAMSIAVAETRFTARQENKVKAYYIARSGAQAVADYMIGDANDDAADLIGKESDWNEQIGGGRFKVSVANDLPNNAVNITSTGEYYGVQQTAKIRVSRSSEGIGGVFQHAIAAKGKISVSSNGNKTTIEGTVASKNQGNVANPIVLDKAKAEGGTLIDPNMVFPPIVLPPDRMPPISYDIVLGNINYSSGPTIASAEGVPKYVSAGDIKIKNTSFRITGNGVVHLYVAGDIILDTNSKFDVNPEAKLYVYVVGKRSIKLIGNGAQNSIFLYAPDSDIKWNNAQPNNDFYGAIIGNTVSLTNQLLIRHNPDMVNDVELDTSGSGVTFTGYTWID